MEYRLAEVSKNRKGTKASDFSFETIEGEVISLEAITASDNILLIFFDPDCDHCREVLQKISEDIVIPGYEEVKNPLIVAVYSGDEKELWRIFSQSLPENWIVGFDPMTIYDNEIYIINQLPTVYLLDANKTILAKNIRL